ncbi:MAG: sodium/calcium exchanger protein [Verrucomicrobia bacterium]|nr:sodium/calcium exchanger protein [Verrucomicrobiota bacterium]
MQSLVQAIESTGHWAPLFFTGGFIAASFLMIWRLEAMTESGFEGTVLGTLVMPYCSGIGNLVFAFMLGAQRGPGSAVMENALVNNVTNLTLLIGLPALIWGMSLSPGGRKKSVVRESHVNRLSLMLTLVAGLFFTGAVWALGRDGRIDFSDGLVLVGLFLFWQVFHVFEVLKTNVRQNQSFGWMLVVDAALLAIGACGIYVSTDWLVEWVSRADSGLFSTKYLGWLSGWLMVLPNALLALYYGWRGRPEVVYTSQAGDGHICIPLCVGVYALYQPLPIPSIFREALVLLAAALVMHFLLTMVFKGVPRWLGIVLIAAYGVFLYKGLPR